MPAQIASTAPGAWARIIPPDRDSVFADRARRFHELADRHALGDWLRFLGRLTEAQHAALRQLRDLPPPSAEAIGLANANGMPPLPPRQGQLPRGLRDVLGSLSNAVADHAPEPAKRAIARLGRLSPDRLGVLATRTTQADWRPEDRDILPLVGAALQVLWTAAAATLGTAGIPPLDVAGVCPCCGSLPVVGVVRSSGEVANLRYLHCSLCNTEWNFPRAQCSVCDASGHVAYRQIGDAALPGAIRAETCDDCRSYRKIIFRDKAPQADPVADDLATLALDVLVDQAGYARSGPNLLFVPG